MTIFQTVSVDVWKHPNKTPNKLFVRIFLWVWVVVSSVSVDDGQARLVLKNAKQNSLFFVIFSILRELVHYRSQKRVVLSHSSTDL